MFVALTYLVLLLAACGVAYLVGKRITGMRITRQTVSDDLSMLRRSPDGPGPAVTSPGASTGSVGSGTQAEITARQLPGG